MGGSENQRLKFNTRNCKRAKIRPKKLGHSTTLVRVCNSVSRHRVVLSSQSIRQSPREVLTELFHTLFQMQPSSKQQRNHGPWGHWKLAGIWRTKTFRHSFTQSGAAYAKGHQGEVLTMQISYQSVLSTWNIQHFKKSVLDVFLCIKNCEHGLMAWGGTRTSRLWDSSSWILRRFVWKIDPNFSPSEELRQHPVCAESNGGITQSLSCFEKTEFRSSVFGFCKYRWKDYFDR